MNKKHLRIEFGFGYTLYNTQGGWRHADGGLAIEKGATVLVLAEETPGIRKQIVDFAERVKQIFRQEAVAVGITQADFFLC